MIMSDNPPPQIHNNIIRILRISHSIRVLYRTPNYLQKHALRCFKYSANHSLLSVGKYLEFVRSVRAQRGGEGGRNDDVDFELTQQDEAGYLRSLGSERGSRESGTVGKVSIGRGVVEAKTCQRHVLVTKTASIRTFVLEAPPS